MNTTRKTTRRITDRDGNTVVWTRRPSSIAPQGAEWFAGGERVFATDADYRRIFDLPAWAKATTLTGLEFETIAEALTQVSAYLVKTDSPAVERPDTDEVAPFADYREEHNQMIADNEALITEWKTIKEAGEDTPAPAADETRRFGAVWVDDAISRELDIGDVVKTTDRFVWLTQTAEHRREMRDAAQFDIDEFVNGAFDNMDGTGNEEARRRAAAAERVLGALDRSAMKTPPTGNAAPAVVLTAAQQRLRDAEAQVARFDRGGSGLVWAEVMAEWQAAQAAAIAAKDTPTDNDDDGGGNDPAPPTEGNDPMNELTYPLDSTPPGEVDHARCEGDYALHLHRCLTAAERDEHLAEIDRLNPPQMDASPHGEWRAVVGARADQIVADGDFFAAYLRAASGNADFPRRRFAIDREARAYADTRQQVGVAV